MSARSEARWKRKGQQENNQLNALHGMLEALRAPRRACQSPLSTPANASRTTVRRWMRANVQDYDSATQLAEAANAIFALPGQGLDDETHWVWDEAANACLWED